LDLNKKKKNLIQLSCNLALELPQFHKYVLRTDIRERLEMHLKHPESSKSEQSTAWDLSKCDQEQTVEFRHLLPLSSLLWLMFCSTCSVQCERWALCWVCCLCAKKSVQFLIRVRGLFVGVFSNWSQVSPVVLAKPSRW